MKVLLGFPFRDDGPRGKIFNKVQPEVMRMYPFDGLYVADSEHQPFNRAASRNLIVDYADFFAYDVVVICDADSIPEEQNLHTAINEAAQDGRLHIPFDKVRVVPSNCAKHTNNRYLRTKPLYTYGPSCGGIFVIRPSKWIHTGGMDERIVGWGYEDQIFLVAVNTFIGGPVYHNGNLYNFQHPRGGEPDYSVANSLLRDEYQRYERNSDKIRELQRGSNRFCPNEGPAGPTFEFCYPI